MNCEIYNGLTYYVCGAHARYILEGDVPYNIGPVYKYACKSHMEKKLMPDAAFKWRVVAKLGQ